MMYHSAMHKALFSHFCVSLFLFFSLSSGMFAQQQPAQPRGDIAYGEGFFDQLQAIFGKFRDSDLQRVFKEAKAIQCSELIADKGEWRAVAFFNEDRSLGDWYRKNIQEVKINY